MAVALAPNDFIPIMFCPPLVLALATNRGQIARGLAIRSLHYLGTISYSIYLTHYCVLSAVRELPMRLSDMASVGLTVLLTLIVSAGTYHLIEMPARRWLGEWTHKSVRGELGTLLAGGHG